MESAIYGLIDPVTMELRYVGVTVRPLEKRLGQHIREARRMDPRANLYRNRWINSVLSVGREPNIILLEQAPADWTEAECFWIAYMRSLGSRLCNTATGGKGARGWKWSEETRLKRKLADARRKPISSETRARISAGLKGKKKWVGKNREHLKMPLRTGEKMPEEWKQAISRALKGKTKITPEGRAALSRARKGKPLSVAHRAKLSAAKIGKPSSKRGIALSAEQKAKISATKRARATWRKLQMNLFEI